ncbi:hypothetical protein B0H14DRAFT_3165891 [Mycena olivaceomarginata]|nr:hypothetical protein B0H14DRAFT_3165891 [Mycena olivaceomarginata]
MASPTNYSPQRLPTLNIPAAQAVYGSPAALSALNAQRRQPHRLHREPAPQRERRRAAQLGAFWAAGEHLWGVARGMWRVRDGGATNRSNSSFVRTSRHLGVIPLATVECLASFPFRPSRFRSRTTLPASSVLPEKSCVFLSFLDAQTASAFYAGAVVRKLALHAGAQDRVGQGEPGAGAGAPRRGAAMVRRGSQSRGCGAPNESPFSLPLPSLPSFLGYIVPIPKNSPQLVRSLTLASSQVMQAITQSGASRNVYLGGLDEGMTEEMLRDELSRFGLIDQVGGVSFDGKKVEKEGVLARRVKIVRDKNIGFVHFLSIGVATKVVNTLPTDPAWAGKRVNYGKDRCAYVPKSHQAAAHQAQAAAAQSLMGFQSPIVGQNAFASPIGTTQQTPFGGNGNNNGNGNLGGGGANGTPPGSASNVNAQQGSPSQGYAPYTPAPFSPDALSAMMGMGMFGGMGGMGMGGMMSPMSPGGMGGLPDLGMAGGNRTVYLGNIHPETSTEDLCNAIRGGVLQSIRYMADKHIAALVREGARSTSCTNWCETTSGAWASCARVDVEMNARDERMLGGFITFIDPAAAFTFFQVSSYQGLTLNNRRLKIGWGKNSGPLPPTLALAVHAGATRNVYIGNVEDFEVFSEERLKTDFGEFGDIELVNFLKEKNCAFVNFTNISNAIKAIDAIKNRPEYANLRIAHGKDRCANPPRSGPQGSSGARRSASGNGPSSAEPLSAVEHDGEMDFDVEAVQAEAENADAAAEGAQETATEGAASS